MSHCVRSPGAYWLMQCENTHTHIVRFSMRFGMFFFRLSLFIYCDFVGHRCCERAESTNSPTNDRWIHVREIDDGEDGNVPTDDRQSQWLYTATRYIEWRCYNFFCVCFALKTKFIIFCESNVLNGNRNKSLSQCDNSEHNLNSNVKWIECAVRESSTGIRHSTATI